LKFEMTLTGWLKDKEGTPASARCNLRESLVSTDWGEAVKWSVENGSPRSKERGLRRLGSRPRASARGSDFSAMPMEATDVTAASEAINHKNPAK
jgi:hypothetical protein